MNESLLTFIQNGRCCEKSLMPLPATTKEQFAGNVFCSIEEIPLDNSVTNMGYCVKGYRKLLAATRVSPCFLYSKDWCLHVNGYVFEFLMDFFVRSTSLLDMATEWKVHNTNFCSAGKMSCISRSLKKELSSMSTSYFGAIPNQVLIFQSSGRRCSRVSPSNGNSCFVAA